VREASTPASTWHESVGGLSRLELRVLDERRARAVCPECRQPSILLQLQDDAMPARSVQEPVAGSAAGQRRRSAVVAAYDLASERHPSLEHQRRRRTRPEPSLWTSS